MENEQQQSWTFCFDKLFRLCDFFKRKVITKNIGLFLRFMLFKGVGWCNTIYSITSCGTLNVFK